MQPLAPGLVARRAELSVEDAADRAVAAIAERGLSLAARIDHAAAAERAGLALAATELLIFGDARGGTPLMAQHPTLAIDLPLKLLVWEDADGATWVGYNDPDWLAARHGVASKFAPALAAMKAGLDSIAEAAAGAVQSS